jgi:taurine dioxygenase
MTLSFRPLNPHFGVEVDGVDLAGEVPDAVFAEIVAAYYRHSVLLFRGQHLAPAAQARLTYRFGKPKIETRKQFNLREHPEVSALGNVVDADGRPLAFFNRQGESWHTDGVAACHVDAATLLYAVQVPRQGGDTMFASAAVAYETLPPALRAQAGRLRMRCSFHAHNDKIREADPASHVALTPEERAALPDVWHDVVQVHPVTGRTVLYLYDSALEYDGLPERTAAALMTQLFAHATREGFTYRHRWWPGDLMIWDNHATLHSATAVGPYENDLRLMHRSFVYTWPTARPLDNIDERNAIFGRA